MSVLHTELSPLSQLLQDVWIPRTPQAALLMLRILGYEIPHIWRGKRLGKVDIKQCYGNISRYYSSLGFERNV